MRAKEKRRRDDPTGARSDEMTMCSAIKTSSEKQADAAAARREIRNISCLLGGSRRDIGAGSAKATVFKGHCPVAPIIRCMNFPTAAGGGIAGPNSTGHDGPDWKHEQGSSPVNCRH